MQPTHPFARLLFFAGIFLLFSIPVLSCVMRTSKKHEPKRKELTQSLTDSTKSPAYNDNRKPGNVTIVI